MKLQLAIMNAHVVSWQFIAPSFYPAILNIPTQYSAFLPVAYHFQHYLFAVQISLVRRTLKNSRAHETIQITASEQTLKSKTLSKLRNTPITQ